MKNSKRAEAVLKRWEGVPSTVYSMMCVAEAKQLDVLERPEILSYLPHFKGKTILDLAAGIGRYTGEFAKEAEKVVAVDIAKNHIEQNRLNNAVYKNIDYICKDAMDLQLEPNRFDLIFISWLFMYLEDEEVTFLVRKISTWLKPGGTLFFRESCAARLRRSEVNDYFAIYRGLSDYPQFFKEGFSLVKEGSVMAYEDVMANPFLCYWVYSKSEI